MANLEFCDTHNMVAYLNKSEGSEGFHQIVDFLNHSHIRYALIENPTIYVSLIQQFWQTATASTLDSGEIQITATIDGKVKIITEASIRRHLKLEDSDGISTFPITNFFEQLALMGAQFFRVKDQQSQLSLITHPQTPAADEVVFTQVVDVRHVRVLPYCLVTYDLRDARQGCGNVIDMTPTGPQDSLSYGLSRYGSDEGQNAVNHNESGWDLVS
ncbi:hypothetical protein Tco_0713573 [Tanacetum coccineum]